MKYIDYLKGMRQMQELLIGFIENESSSDIDFLNIQQYFDDQKIRETKLKLKEALYLIVKILSNHHRTTNFFDKFERIILLLKDSIQHHFTNREIINIFIKNKRILFFLLEQKIISPDKFALSPLNLSNDYLPYLFPKFSNLIGKDAFEYTENDKKQLLDESNYDIKMHCIDDNEFEIFKTNRKNGENDDFVCTLIRNDSIDEFVAYVNRNSYSLSSKIKESIFETNSVLLKNQPTLIEYAAFFGSIQIFNYLRLNNVQLTSSLWTYAIHSQNPEMIHLLEENSIKPPNDDYNKCLFDSIRCHHIEISKYIQNKYFQVKNDVNFDVFENALKFRNFAFFPNDMNCRFRFWAFACKYDYFDIFEILSKTPKFDINSLEIFIQIFVNVIQNKKYFFFLYHFELLI